MIQRHFLPGSLLVLAGFLCAPTASAYFTPEEVLLNQDFFIPPAARDSLDRVARQQAESEARREREQQQNYDDNHPAAEEETQSSSSVAAEQPTVVDPLSAITYPELKNTLKLLQRIERNQQHALYAERFPENIAGTLHAGAPGLAPTGAGGMLSAVVMIGSVLWTLSRAKRAAKNTRG
ncbi:MAG: hypothetical protein PHI23_01740 [Candidatus Peribacteraceae bacterium]|nr:hypothetical protein [Candidatus Peribacteraceae bacterium]